MAVLLFTEFTDPSCPYAWSAEPVRRELRWRYGDELAWSITVVGLSETRQEHEAKGLTPAALAAGWASLAGSHGMPMDTAELPAIAASLPACRAIVATRVHAPDAERAVLRALRVRGFGGQLLDDPRTIRGAAEDAGLDGDEFERWLHDDAVEAALRADLDAARAPSHAAAALAHKLASWPGGLRYTCPSYEISRVDDPERSIAVPGLPTHLLQRDRRRQPRPRARPPRERHRRRGGPALGRRAPRDRRGRRRLRPGPRRDPPAAQPRGHRAPARPGRPLDPCRLTASVGSARDGPVAQWSEQWTHNPSRAGSIPARPM